MDLGCGAHSYIPSVGLDISPKMLQFNDNCSKKIVGDLEKKMPFEDEVFDSVTAIFLFNYIVNYQQLLQEIYRILKKNGVLVAVLSCKEINEWQRQKQVNSFTAKEWKQNIKNARFIVTHSQVDQLLFLKGRKNSF
ncbi:class I SAM-dependent methyltransferase [Candidatus Woesearchaeota archaeon]|nr:class I SAM-dependent methyltransferase [Candidatus Woesearchaeota archaeon]